MLRTTRMAGRGTGFQFDFKNGYTAGVQFGPTSYSEYRGKELPPITPLFDLESRNAEVAAWKTEGATTEDEEREWVTEKCTDMASKGVAGWLNADEVIDFLVCVKNLEP